MAPSPSDNAPRWVSLSLILAGIYNLAWGGFVIVFPQAIFRLAGIAPPLYPGIWQCVGMIVGVYGIGYLIAARNPNRHWPIVLVGLLGKIFGPIGFVYAAATDQLPWSWGLTIVGNDLIWWAPFLAALYYAWRYHSNPRPKQTLTFEQAIRTMVSHRGATLDSLSRKSLTLVVFLRHAGCTFCREALADLQQQRDAIEKQGVSIAVVHMGSLLDATMLVEHYGLENVHRFSDPECVLYDAFDIERGSLLQVLGPEVWWRGLTTAFFRGHGMGPVQGDVFRMPGVFAVKDGAIVDQHPLAQSCDRPNYQEFAARVRTQFAEDSRREREAVSA